jgi:hypothetical protein
MCSITEKKSSCGSRNQKKLVIKNQKNVHERSDEDFDEPPVKPVQKAKPQKEKVEPKAANQQPPNQSQQINVPKKSSNNKKGWLVLIYHLLKLFLCFRNKILSFTTVQVQSRRGL